MLNEQPFVVVDVETTGLDPLIDQPVEICAARVIGGRVESTFATLVNPGIPIRPDASAIHHLTDDDVAGGLPPIQARAQLARFIAPGDVLVAHNASFDRSFLAGVSAAPWLCTLRMAKHLWPDAPNHSNQTLRYYLKVRMPTFEAQAHRGMPDVFATSSILDQGIKAYLSAGGVDEAVAFVAFVNAPLRIECMPFGQHKGKSLAEVDTDYLRWAASEAEAVRKDADLRSALHAELARRERRITPLRSTGTERAR